MLVANLAVSVKRTMTIEKKVNGRGGSRSCIMGTEKVRVRRKQCAHCLFGKKAICAPENLEAMRAAVLEQGPKAAECHEHSEVTICHGYFRRTGLSLGQEPQFVQENGDKRALFSHVTKVARKRVVLEGMV